MLTTPTIVLVHGAVADTAVWAPVARELLDRGHTVFVLPVGNRGLFDDAAAVGSFVEQLACPVVLAGHSYGGAVIGVAGTARNVVGLVFVAGYVLDRGESVGELQSQFPETKLTTSRVLQAHRSADGVEGAEMSVAVTFFRRLLATGVDPRLAGILTFFQRPLARIAVTEPASAEARSRLPGCGIFARANQSTNSDLQRFGYRRAELREVPELDGPHLVMHTLPPRLADAIERAADTARWETVTTTLD